MYPPCLPLQVKRHTHAQNGRFCIMRVQAKLYLIVDKHLSRFAYAKSESKARVQAAAALAFAAQGPMDKMKAH